MTANRKLTKRMCDAAQPSLGDDGHARERVLWDGTVKGFGLRVSPAGAKSFILMYRAGKDGKGRKTDPLRKVTIGTFGSPWTVETARTEALRLRGLVAAGADPAGEKTKKRAAKQQADEDSVRAAVEDWLRRDRPDKRTVGEVTRVMKRDVLPLWGDRPLAAIRKRDVIELLDGIADRGAGIAANRALSYIHRFFKWCTARDRIAANPAQFVEKPTQETARDRVLSNAELVEVWRAVDGMVEPFAAGVRLLILTAARRTEIFEARWSELEGKALRLPPSRVKNKQGRIIPLSPPALAIVGALLRFADSPWLLTLDGRHPFSNFGHAKAELDRRILKARGENAEPIPPWTIHDLRRSVATGLQRFKVPLEVTEAVLGHTSGKRSGIAAVYQTHDYLEEASEALDLWGEHMMRLLDPTPAKVVPMRRRAKA